MSNNLNLTQVTENQASPEVPINDKGAELDAALTETLAIDLSAGNATVTASQQRRNVLFQASGVATTGRTVTFSSGVERGFMLFECAAANTNTISLIKGSTTLTLSPGRLYVVYLDGTANGIVARDVGGTSEPNDLHVFIPGVLSSSQLMFRMKVTRAFTLPANLSGGYGTAGTASTGTKVVDIKKNGSSVATITYTASATGTLATSGGTAQSFAVGDVLTIVGPASADATLADVTIDLFGSR
jgi:hypothetical protein